MITLVLFASFLLINLTDGSVSSPLDGSSGCCGPLVDVSETGATDDIGDQGDIEADGNPYAISGFEALAMVTGAIIAAYCFSAM